MAKMTLYAASAGDSFWRIGSYDTVEELKKGLRQASRVHPIMGGSHKKYPSSQGDSQMSQGESLPPIDSPPKMGGSQLIWGGVLGGVQISKIQVTPPQNGGESQGESDFWTGSTPDWSEIFLARRAKNYRNSSITLRNTQNFLRASREKIIKITYSPLEML